MSNPSKSRKVKQEDSGLHLEDQDPWQKQDTAVRQSDRRPWLVRGLCGAPGCENQADWGFDQGSIARCVTCAEKEGLDWLLEP
jgi:hypothetical protein